MENSIWHHFGKVKLLKCHFGIKKKIKLKRSPQNVVVLLEKKKKKEEIPYTYQNGAILVRPGIKTKEENPSFLTSSSSLGALPIRHFPFPHWGRLNPSLKRKIKSYTKCSIYMKKIRVATRSGALDCIGCTRSWGVRSIARNRSGIPQRRHEAMAARATRETRSMWNALDRCFQCSSAGVLFLRDRSCAWSQM
jgi:hypothetical protein